MSFGKPRQRNFASKAPKDGDVVRSSSRQNASRARKPTPPAPGTARRYMMWLLARREYAAVDLRKKALSKGHLAEEVDAALASFQSLGLQDDTRYAGMKARQCAPRYGNRRVQQVLQAKNIESEVVAQQLADLPDEDTRAARLIEAFESQPWSPALQQKVWRRLATRGFGTPVIKRALALLKLRCPEAEDGIEEGRDAPRRGMRR